MTQQQDGQQQKNVRFYAVLSLLLIAVTIPILFLISVLLSHVQQKLIETQFKPDAIIDLKQTEYDNDDDAGVSSKTELRIAIAPVVSPENAYGIYREFSEYIGKHLQCDVIVLYRSTYMEINDLLKNEMCDAAFICTYAFIRGKNTFGLKPLVIPVVNGSKTYQSFVIVHAESDFASLLDLKEKKFVSADITSTTGWLFPALWLLDHHVDPLNYFSDHIISGSHDKSIILVQDGYCDGTAVHSIVYDSMSDEIKAKLRILHKSEKLGMPPFVVPPHLDKELMTSLQSVLLTMHEDSEGRKILKELNFDRFEVVERSFYQIIQEMITRWERYLETQNGF